MQLEEELEEEATNLELSLDKQRKAQLQVSLASLFGPVWRLKSSNFEMFRLNS